MGRPAWVLVFIMACSGSDPGGGDATESVGPTSASAGSEEGPVDCGADSHYCPDAEFPCVFFESDNGNCGGCGNVCTAQTMVFETDDATCKRFPEHGVGTCIDGACDSKRVTDCFRVAATVDESGVTPQCIDSTGDFLSCADACAAEGRVPCVSGDLLYEITRTQHVYFSEEACTTIPADCDPTLLGPYTPYPESLPLDLIRRGELMFDSYDPSACLLKSSAVYQETGGTYPAEIWQRCCCVDG